MFYMHGQIHDEQHLSEMAKGEIMKYLLARALMLVDRLLLGMIIYHDGLGMSDGKIMSLKEFNHAKWREGRTWVARPTKPHKCIAMVNRRLDGLAARCRALGCGLSPKARADDVRHVLKRKGRG